MKEILKTIYRLYNFKIVAVFILIFFIIQIPFLQKVPDFFQITKIEPPKNYLLRLLSIIIGFSGFILTTFLVIYNIFSKRLRRNSFDHILNNPWINLIFSIFGGSLIFILFSIFAISISTEKTITTLLYFSSFITFGNLILQFPLIILSIKHSGSYNSIKRMIGNLKDDDIESLYNPKYKIGDAYSIEYIEKNNIVQLKDIGISAIKENDWGIPQTILNDLFQKLIIKSNNHSNDITLLNKNLHAYAFVSRHLQKIALEENDEITVRVALNNLFRIHSFFAENKIRNIRDNPIDNIFNDFLRNIVSSDAYYSIQQYLSVNLIELIEDHIKSIEYSDEQLPTRDYIFSKKDFDYNSKNEVISNYWFYIKNDLPDIFFNVLKNSIETNNKNIYSHFNSHLHSLFDKITKSNNLTESQENELFESYSFQAQRITELAIENGIFKDVEFYSIHQIEKWLLKEKKYAFRALYDFSRLIKKLNKKNGLDSMLIDNYFMIARSISFEKINIEDKVTIFRIIIERSFEIYNLDTTQVEIKHEIKEQLKWLLDDFIEKQDGLEEIKKEFSEKISKL